MIKSQTTYSKVELSKWALSLALCLSILSISGISNGFQVKHQFISKTEQVISKQNNITKRSISYTRSFKIAYQHCEIIAIGNTNANNLLLYDRLLTVKFISLSKCRQSIVPAIFFRQQKTIPLSTDEASIFDLLG